MGNSSVNVAWGIEFGGSAVRIVRVTRTADGFRADNYAETPLDQRWDGPPTPAQAAARLGVSGLDGPLVACVPDELVLYRSLSLPDADPEALARMADSQLESLVPAQAELFATDWSHHADPHAPGQRRVLLCAARRDALARCVDACGQLGAPPAGAIPAALATALAWADLCAGNDKPIVLLDVGARCTSLVVLHNRKPIRCGVVDQGGDHWTEAVAAEIGIPPADVDAKRLTEPIYPADPTFDAVGHAARQRAVARWARQVREVYDHCVEDIPDDARPARCILFGRPARAASLTSVVAATLEMEVLENTRPTRLTFGEGVEFDQAATAIGAAMAHMSTNGSMVDLTAAPAAPTRHAAAKRWWRPAALAAWLLTLVLAGYAIDVGEADRLTEQADHARAALGPDGELDRELTMGKVLTVTGAPPLELMDRIAAMVPPKVLLRSWRYNREGTITLAGIAPSPTECRLLRTRLSALGRAEPRSTRFAAGKYQFEIELQLDRVLPPVATQPAEPKNATASKGGGK